MEEMQNIHTSMPLIGDKAPAFRAVTTEGPINFPDDYKSKWVILFRHPADFTPVCTTEFMTFASMADEFKALNTELVGLSIDSLYAHIAWLRKIQELESCRSEVPCYRGHQDGCCQKVRHGTFTVLNPGSRGCLRN